MCAEKSKDGRYVVIISGGTAQINVIDSNVTKSVSYDGYRLSASHDRRRTHEPYLLRCFSSL